MGDRTGLRHKISGLADALESRIGLSLGSESMLAVYLAFFVVINFAGVSFLSPSVWAPYVTSNSNAPAGAAWIEGGELHWADGSNEHWLGTTETNVVTTSASGPVGAAWIEGGSLHWIDTNSDERSYSGAPTGDSPSATNGAVWMENNFIHYIDESGNERAAVVPWGDGFEDGDAAEWSGSNYYVKSDNARGTYSIGSDGQGTLDAEIIPAGWNGGIRPGYLQYQWWEESSQTGFTVDFIDSSGNYVIRTGGNNPQWEVSDGSGATTIYSGNGQYRDWIKYEFNFDWANCQYDYTWENTATGHTETGTRSLNQCTSIEKIRLSADNWGSANYMRLDNFNTKP